MISSLTFLKVALLLVVLSLFEVLDGCFEEFHLVIVICVHPLLHNIVSRIVFHQIDDHSVLVAHWFLVLSGVAFHKLVNLDALEGSYLFDVLSQSSKTATHSNHDLVRFDHQGLLLSSNHVLALLFAWLLVDLDDRKDS